MAQDKSTKASTGSGTSGHAETIFSADSAQQIWQAGLGAFTRAQAEGSKAFESLVKEGVEIQRRTQQSAEEKVNEARQKMSSMANDFGHKAVGQWGKLESIFEDRVALALRKLGMPNAQDVEQLSQRIDELTRAVQALSERVASIAPGAPAAPTTPAKTSAAETSTETETAPPKKRRATPRKSAQ